MSGSVKVRAGVVGTGQRASAFVGRFQKFDDVELTTLCDTNEERLHSYARQKSCEGVKLFTNLDEMLAGDRVDAVVITVPDKFHKDVAVRCFEAGKHVMLEKPMALTTEDCREIIRAKEKSGKVLQVGFVLRCAPFYRKIKDILDEDRLGQMMSISAAEYLGVSHSASYMRRWHRKRANSGSFMLAKCSHDIDLLSWFSGSPATRVASFGENNFFLPSKRPATHCAVCKETDCRFRFNPEKGTFVFMTEEDRKDPSKNGFDLCVYNDDKDVIDNQMSIIEFKNGVRATFALQLFRGKGGRFITITGSDAYLTGCVEENKIILLDSKTGAVEEIPIGNSGGGHSGGDERFVREFIDCVKNGTEPVADLQAGLASTVVGVAMEKARETGAVVKIDPVEYQW